MSFALRGESLEYADTPEFTLNSKANNNDNSNIYKKDLNLEKEKSSMNSENQRRKTILLLGENNYTIFSDNQLCSIVDTYIYENENKFDKCIKPIFENTDTICEIDYINSFFGLFGFQKHDKSNHSQENKQRFLNFAFPFINKEEDINEYIHNHKKTDKSFSLWLKYNFHQEGSNEDEQLRGRFESEFDALSYLENVEISKDTCFFLHLVGVSFQLKFTCVYIQKINNTNEEYKNYTFKAFDLGYLNATNRIFIGLYKEDDKIYYFLPAIKIENRKDNFSKSSISPDFPEEKAHESLIFIPNYGPIYIKSLKNDYEVGLHQDLYNTFYINNDFPIFVKTKQKQINNEKLTSLSKTRLVVQDLIKNDEQIQATNSKNYLIVQLVFEKIFNFPVDKFINLDSPKIKSEENFEYSLYFASPMNTISYIPILKITSPLKLENIMITNLSHIFFIATFEHDEKTNIYFGDGDFGSSSLDDMFICPTNITTKKLISTFIVSNSIICNDSSFVRSLPPGIIVLHNNLDNKTLITHYSRTEHFWKKEKEIEIGSLNNGFIFFLSSKYYIFYKTEDKIELITYNFLDGANKTIDIKGIENQDKFKSVLFYNNNFYFQMDDDDKYQKWNPNEKQHENENDNDIDEFRINSINATKNDTSFYIDVDDNSSSFIPSFPIALEINQRLHVYKYKENDPDTKDKIESPFYHPANKNSVLYYSILSMFYRYRRHFSHELPQTNDRNLPFIIHTSIDCSFNRDFKSIFTGGTCPGIYAEPITESASKNYTYKHCWDVPPNILYIYFNNGELQTGITERRTLCQLAASFACSYAISVFRSDGKIICYEPPQQNPALWNIERCQKMEKNLVATYGTLLEMKNDFEFEFALNVLETTKYHVDDFKNFLKSIYSS